jgi:hypothetical protein
MQALSPSVQSLNLPNLQTPWIDSPFFSELLDRAPLSDAQKRLVQHYADHGYLVIDLEIPDFDSLSRAIVQGLASQYHGNARIQDAWFFNDAVRSLAIQPQILALLEVLYQRQPIPFQTLNFPVGTEQPTHSDTIHFNCVPGGFMCGVWVALEDIDAENGPLHYYPGSHKLPVVNFQDLGLGPGYHNYPLYEQFLAGLIRSRHLDRVELAIKKGQAIIWSANLLHGGSPIRDPRRSRHSQVTHYFFEHCLYYKPMLSTALRKRLLEVVDIRTRAIVPQQMDGKTVQYQDMQAFRTLASKLVRSHPRLAKPLNQLEQFRRAWRGDR